MKKLLAACRVVIHRLGGWLHMTDYAPTIRKIISDTVARSNSMISVDYDDFQRHCQVVCV